MVSTHGSVVPLAMLLTGARDDRENDPLINYTVLLQQDESEIFTVTNILH